MDDKIIMARNKVKLVVQGFNQVEGLNYHETYTSVSRLKSIWILLAYATYKGFKLFQINMKLIFLNNFIKKKVYVKQSPSLTI